MKQGDIIKYVLIAGAIYLAYRYLSQSGLFTGLIGQQPALPAPQPAVTQPAQIAPPSQKVSVTAANLEKYAKENMPSGWDGKLNISQWNWVVSKMTSTDQQTDLSFGESVPDPVTVDDYMARRVKAGISGLDATRLDFSRLAQLLPASNWSM